MPTIRPQHVSGRRIADVVERLSVAALHGDTEQLVTGVSQDSRDVRAGDVYVARPGDNTHGIAHVGQAVRNGAQVVLTDRPSVAAATEAGAATVVEVDDPRGDAGPLAAWVYGDPAADLLLIAVTGTNGKTTTAYLVEAGLRSAGHLTGLIGTVETRVADEVIPSARTTPEATDVHALLAVMRERGVTAVAMEVSSHALVLGRVAGLTFDVAAFTNLSQDHLDFHPDMEDYFRSKAMLFTPARASRGVVGVDDEWGVRLAREATIPVTTVGLTGEWRLVEETRRADLSNAALIGPDGGLHEIDIHLMGGFNLRNAAVAYVALLCAGVSDEQAHAGLTSLQSVPGRMERIDAGQPFVALVDYAHTPEAVDTLLIEARALAGDAGRVVVVIGCGGDRDQGKRPMMGAAAARRADVAVLTSDNPRSEDPAEILAAMERGARGAHSNADLVVEPDRQAAIALAVERSGPGDVLIVAGKGHEQGQEFADRVVPFDDRKALRAELVAHGYAGVA
jgi:UDP-N-acetylmuramoyl-L-alanyl-D-glutamate--2,6-diaminopimelate ligase